MVVDSQVFQPKKSSIVCLQIFVGKKIANFANECRFTKLKCKISGDGVQNVAKTGDRLSQLSTRLPFF